jgi:hypothetical protein
MAHLPQGILGGFSGTVGTVIGFFKHGKYFIRAKNISHHDAGTDKQKAVRNRFKGFLTFASRINLEVIRPIWSAYGITMTGWSLFMKKNIASFDKDGNIADYSNLTLSLGVLPLPVNIVVTGSGATDGSLLIIWKDNSGVDEARATDRLRVVAVKENQPYVLTGLDAVRSDTQVPVTVPCEAGEKLHLYLYFQDEARSMASPSIHAEVTIGEGQERGTIELSHEETTPQTTQTPQSTQGTQNVAYNQPSSSGTDGFSDDNWRMAIQLPYFVQDDNYILLFGRNEMVNSSLTASPMTDFLFLDSSLRVGMTTTYCYRGG